ncbi:MAG TPA: aminotransferase class V-fold PLP-dependent enzyme [Thermoanaerobaculia bacterium]|nr:aminotransferase class V-fold PLP-dependent enzyme [Thermoanaerobaculia bacterium]
MKAPIYMDNHATTPIDPRVLDAMMPYLTTAFGNAASRNHLYGWEAEAAVDEARQKVAAFLGATAAEIVFTSGATESDNLAILGAARHAREKGNHIVTGATEHKAVLDSCRELEREGFEVTVLAPDRFGQVSPAQVESALTERTVLVTLMLANNEIGTIHPLREIAAICRARGVLVHTDAVQGAGKIPFDVETFGVDLVSITAHKIYGPKGCGALYVRGRAPRVRLSPMIHGGGHERGLRSGTLNVPGIVGLGRACELAAAELPEESRRLRRLRARLWARISALDDLHLNGYPLPEIDADGNLEGPEWRIPGNLNVSFGGVEGEALIAGIRDVAVSSGAACTSASIEPSHVQKAIGVPDALAYSAIRFGLGRFNTEDEVDYAAGEVVRAVRELRAQRVASADHPGR